MQIKVNGKFYDFFNDVSISTDLDAVASTFAFSGKYDPTNPVHRELFKPLTYAKVEFFDGDQLLSTGTITNYDFNSTAKPQLVVLSGYSLPGVLEDVQIPFSNYQAAGGGVSLQSINMTLEEITNKVIKPFGLKLIVYDSVTKECAQVIPKTAAKPEETIKSYICKIANQKNVVVSHDIHGNLIMFRPNIKAAPKLFLTGENTLSMSLNIDGRGIHSDLTCVRQPEKGTGDNAFSEDPQGKSFDGLDGPAKVFKVGTVDTVHNPLVTAFRPLVDVLSSGTFYDTHRAAVNRRASELKNIKIDFSLDHWEKVSVGDVIEVQNQEIFINNRTKMILQTTVISESADKKVMSGTLVMPETFTGDTPVNIFL